MPIASQLMKAQSDSIQVRAETPWVSRRTTMRATCGQARERPHVTASTPTAVVTMLR
jgi:hypothetical protein